jgi:3D-(3,5/4)-trihydroxycyclohexane-1,2-dione acylhydrolase (decyclizing)
LKVTVLVVENHGFQSIHALQRARTGRSFGLEFRAREGERDHDGGLTGDYVPVDLAANARAYGCATHAVRTVAELEAALDAARAADGPTVIVVHVDPLRLTLSSDCWWDVGVPAVSGIAETRAAVATSDAGRGGQRWHG